jgi:hypothetical protein
VPGIVIEQIQPQPKALYSSRIMTFPDNSTERKKLNGEIIGGNVLLNIKLDDIFDEMQRFWFKIGVHQNSIVQSNDGDCIFLLLLPQGIEI